MLPALSEPIALPPGTAVRLARVAQPGGSPVPERFPHFHGLAELVFITAGTGRFVGEAGDVAFGPGAVLHAPGMAIHDFAFDPGPRSWTLVQFDPRACAAPALALPRLPGGAALDPAGRARTDALLDWLDEALAQDAPPDAVQVLLGALLLAVRDALGGDALDHPQPVSALARFRPLLEHWDRAPGEVLGLAEAASRCALSPAYFSRLFKATFGSGFVAYQTRFRLQQASRLLASGERPVSQVGYALGFRSPAYFAQCYRAAFGVAPSAHRGGARVRPGGARRSPAPDRR